MGIPVGEFDARVTPATEIPDCSASHNTSVVPTGEPSAMIATAAEMPDWATDAAQQPPAETVAVEALAAATQPVTGSELRGSAVAETGAFEAPAATAAEPTRADANTRGPARTRDAEIPDSAASHDTAGASTSESARTAGPAVEIPDTASYRRTVGERFRTSTHGAEIPDSAVNERMATAMETACAEGVVIAMSAKQKREQAVGEQLFRPCAGLGTLGPGNRTLKGWATFCRPLRDLENGRPGATGSLVGWHQERGDGLAPLAGVHPVAFPFPGVSRRARRTASRAGKYRTASRTHGGNRRWKRFGRKVLWSPGARNREGMNGWRTAQSSPRDSRQ